MGSKKRSKEIAWTSKQKMISLSLWTISKKNAMRSWTSQRRLYRKQRLFMTSSRMRTSTSQENQTASSTQKYK